MWFSKTFNSLILRDLKYNLVSEIRFYSVYAPIYKRAIFRKEDQEKYFKENEGKRPELTIRPSTGSESCSEFYDARVRKFTNRIMLGGCKHIAKRILADTFENIKIMQLDKYYNTSHENRKDIILDPKKIFHIAVNNCLPSLELQKISRGGISYQVPVPLSDKRAEFMSMKWLIETARDKGNAEKLSDVLAVELINAAQNKGRTIKKKHDIHKLCEANRAYAHYRWI